MDDFTKHYLIAALWSSTGDDGEPLDAAYSEDDIAPECVAKAMADCERFQRENAAMLARAYETRGYDVAQAGHDFWLTRNGHGAGFWDRGLSVVGDALNAACYAASMVELYVGDDGKIYS